MNVTKNTTWQRTVPKIVVIIFYELEKDSLRKGGIAIVCEKVVNWLGRFACDDCGCNNSRLIHVFAESGVVTQPIESGKAIEVELNDDYFNPKDITIPNGKTTTLILKNKGSKKHTFTVEKLGIDTEVQPGKEKTITVKPKKTGTYDLICRYHFQEGMVGKVIVK